MKFSTNAIRPVGRRIPRPSAGIDRTVRLSHRAHAISASSPILERHDRDAAHEQQLLVGRRVPSKTWFYELRGEVELDDLHDGHGQDQERGKHRRPARRLERRQFDGPQRAVRARVDRLGGPPQRSRGSGSCSTAGRRRC